MLPPNDIIKSWGHICDWIYDKFVEDKGVIIKGIGSFTVAQWEINKGSTNTIRKSVFLIDEKLANDYNLKRNRAYNTGNIREYYLNILSVAQDYKLNENTVTDCFKDVVVAFRKLLYKERDCELPFSKIGKLQIKNKTVTMKFYQEFLDEQNKNWKNRMDNEKKTHQGASYDPDWDADHYEFQKRPSSAICRPASSLSVYRPSSSFAGVIPSLPKSTRPSSAICRPASSLSAYRPSSSFAGVIPSLSESKCQQEIRPASRMSVHSGDNARPASRMSVYSGYNARPASRMSVHLDENARPASRMSVHLDENARPASRMSVHSGYNARPASRMSVHSGYNARPASRMSVHLDDNARPASRMSVHSGDNARPTSRMSVHTGDNARPTSKMSFHSCNSARPASRMSVNSGDYARPGSQLSNLQSDKRPKSRAPVAETCCNQAGPTSSTSNDQLCYSCGIRKHRLQIIDTIKPKTSADNRDQFMSGNNPINALNNPSELKKRQDRSKEISNHNYVTGNKLLDAIKEEKKRMRTEVRYANYPIFNRRPESKSKCIEKKTNMKQSLIKQIEQKNNKKIAEQCSSLKAEKIILNELIESLHEERNKRNDAKHQAKEKYLTILNKQIKEKNEIEKERKKKGEISCSGTVQRLTNRTQYDKHKLAADHIKQQTERNLANCKQKKETIDFEIQLLKRIKEEDEILQKNKLKQKKILAMDALAMSKIECDKNELPRSYPMTFPLKKIGERCRLCKKNALGCPAEKISDLPRWRY